jgi:hypothetical protein
MWKSLQELVSQAQLSKTWRLNLALESQMTSLVQILVMNLRLNWVFATWMCISTAKAT